MADPNDDVMIITHPPPDSGPSKPKRKINQKQAIEVSVLPQTKAYYLGLLLIIPCCLTGRGSSS